MAPAVVSVVLLSELFVGGPEAMREFAPGFLLLGGPSIHGRFDTIPVNIEKHCRVPLCFTQRYCCIKTSRWENISLVEILVVIGVLFWIIQPFVEGKI